MGWLDKVKRNPRDNRVLSKMLFDYLKESREDEPREDGIHISRLAGLCAREYVFQAQIPEAGEEPDPVGVLRMDVGTAVHALIQNEYFGPMGVLIGDWECVQCKQGVKMSKMPGTRCICGGRIRYKEIRVCYEEGKFTGKNRIVGKTDGVLEIEGERWGLEVKTANANFIATLLEPLKDHVFQENCYLHLLNTQYHLGLKRAKIFYVNPDCIFRRGGFPTLEFDIEYDPAYWEMALAAASNLVDVKEQLEGGTLKKLPDRICDSPYCGRAKLCPMADPCFAFGIEKKLNLAKA